MDSKYLYLLAVLLNLKNTCDSLPSELVAEMKKYNLVEPKTNLTMDELIMGSMKQKNNSALVMGGSMDDNGMRLAELDMMLSDDQYRALYQTQRRAPKRRQRRKATSSATLYWPDAIVPYDIRSSDFSEKDIRIMHIALKEWEYYTCVRFRPATSSDYNKVYIRNGPGGCSSQLGMVGGSQALNLDINGCRWKGLYLHEVGHALGLVHEHQLPDRDSYVKINYNNVAPDLRQWFNKYRRSEINSFSTRYQLSSVMHYGINAFARKKGLQTIEAKDKSREHEIGLVWQKELAFSDIKIVNGMYKCASQCTGVRCTGRGFVNRHCKCVCPDGTNSCQVGGNKTPFPKGECKNLHSSDSECEKWAKSAECTLNPTWMIPNCRKSCNKCFGGPGSTLPYGPGDCENEEGDTECDKLAKSGECFIKPADMMRRCQKSCGKCGSTVVGGRCGDTYNAAKCKGWAATGECTKNPRWMLENCKKSCGKCTTTPEGGCRNTHTSDAECQNWAKSGECQKNPRWMLVHCKMACGECKGTGKGDCKDTASQCAKYKDGGSCNTDPAYMLTNCRNTCSFCKVDPDLKKCRNLFKDEARCKKWVADGECSKGDWMERNCKKACGCTDTSSTCVDKHSDKAACKKWASIGECKVNAAWMIPNCRKSCGACSSTGIKPTVKPTAGCQDTHSDKQACKNWAASGECKKNPRWMIPNCRKSCNACTGTGTTGTGIKPTVKPTTGCQDTHSDKQACKNWAASGECKKNPRWMIPNCKKSCNACTGTGTITVTKDCEDKHTDKQACKQWAAVGECNKNPSWMIPNCRKSCNKCDGGGGTIKPKPSECVDKHSDKQACKNWAAAGECDKNPGWMIPNCRKSCTKCGGGGGGGGLVTPPPPEVNCKNKHHDDKACEVWANAGHCSSNPGWMLKNCMMSCGSCTSTTTPTPTTKPTVVVTDCRNKHSSDAQCEDWAKVGECKRNPLWMIPNCRKACGRCGNPLPKNCKNKYNDKDCDIWAVAGHCDINPGWMKPNCARSCKQCKGGGAGGGSAGVKCINQLGDERCEQLAKTGCTRRLVDQCRKSCTECTPEGGVTPKPCLTSGSQAVCADDFKECAAMKAKGECEKNSGYMFYVCKRSCGLCERNACSDKNSGCRAWAKQGLCHSRQRLMLSQCRAACGLCSHTIRHITPDRPTMGEEAPTKY